ncbi:erythromycin esterase family protein [Streptomonospora sp. S1-112]|uniref:Erythromycin esterase family protein n=1 Tax=Streptomonospora mangrovi TaxID=2883123 RepID=A0A9X3SCA3_9ACTN|nr:erythromycin esterase family protein [Streptomonospora mangrovi]MDA0563428.1 erythromycin esterase family protein [Streptomonospora mangrovi]
MDTTSSPLSPAAPAALSPRAVRPLRTLDLDPDDSFADLEWLGDVVGGARVLALGETAHYNRESFQLRRRLLAYLVRRHGFTAYAMETGFAESARADAWVRGGAEPPARVQADGLTSLMGLWRPMRAHLEWMRAHNAGAARPVGFYGIDLPGSHVSLVPGLAAVDAYLAEADPGAGVEAALRAGAEAVAAASPFSAPAAMAAWARLPGAEREALVAGAAGVAERLRTGRERYVGRTGAAAFDRALRAAESTAALARMTAAMAGGDLNAVMEVREEALAATVEWVLEREERVVVAAHNGHVGRWPCAVPGAAPTDSMGMRLARALGTDYRVVGATAGAGHMLNVGADFGEGVLFAGMAPPAPGSLDALMAASCGGWPAGVDVRRLEGADAQALAAAAGQRAGNGEEYTDVAAAVAFDALVHLPRLSPAQVDAEALAWVPEEVRVPFTRWRESVVSTK